MVVQRLRHDFAKVEVGVRFPVTTRIRYDHRPMPEPEPMKTCTRCGPQPRSQFTSDASKPDGLHTRCKSCRKITEKRMRVDPEDEAIRVAKDRLAEIFPTQYARLVFSERQRRHLLPDQVLAS